MLTHSMREEVHRWLERFFRVAVLGVLFCFPAIVAIKSGIVNDPDIWWHLRTGELIVEQRAVPMSDPFSAHGAERPWVAYSWLFELLAFGSYRLLGLPGIVIFVFVLCLAIAVALHRLVLTLGACFSDSLLFTAVGLIGMSQLYSPRPWLLTILFFIFELQLLAEWKSGARRALLGLPGLFAVWANTHVQFLYGLFVLCVVAGACMARKRLREIGYDPRCRDIGLITIGCLLATLLNPYGWRVYKTMWEYGIQFSAFDRIQELQALSFRSLADWCVLFAVLAAAYALGRSKEVGPVPLLLLGSGALLSFRAARDSWFVLIVAVCILASSHAGSRREPAYHPTARERFVLAAGICILLVVVARVGRVSQEKLANDAAERYPASAAAVVEACKFEGPLYNYFDWGGYLIWRLPNLKVSMDGRTNLHGEERIRRNVATWMAGPEWASDSELASAQVVIANVSLPLTSLLRTDGRFELVHQDRVAAVFIAKQGSKPAAKEDSASHSKPPTSRPLVNCVQKG